MYVVCVTVYVKEENRNEFIKAVLENAKNTRKESLNFRFDVLQCLDDPNQFFLYEVYKDESGFVSHKETNHYKIWRETVAPMMAQPREGIKHKNIFPLEEDAFISR
ncbi:MAG: antibiotic biosynthesis monooxygenase [Asgard group archaeon]|nr:antibiotic biosynthesis monooxygenase [Asgard group archaeon]